MTKEALMHELESNNWSLIQLSPLSHNLNIQQQKYLWHCILKECLYHLTPKSKGIQFAI